MHTETPYSRTEALIARYRVEVALTLGAILTVALIAAWAVLAPLLFRIESDNLGLCVSALSAFGGFIAALAFYWGTE